MKRPLAPLGAALLLLSASIGVPSASATNSATVIPDPPRIENPETVFDSLPPIALEGDTPNGEADKYARIDPLGNLYFDEAAAIKDGASQEVIERIRYLNQFAEAFAKPADKNWTNAGEGPFRNYNFCGYGNLGWDKQPVNTLDEGCKQHDQCYDWVGYGKCSCDQDFIDYVDNNLDRMGFNERQQARGARDFFKTRVFFGRCHD